MSSLGKIRKNAENYMLNEVFNNMTPEQYRHGIETAVNKAKNDLTILYNEQLSNLTKQYNRSLQDNYKNVIDIISVELLYELATQMNAFSENDEDIKNQIIDKVQEIYTNTMKQIEKYANSKNRNDPPKEFNKRKKQLEKMFNLKF